MKLFRKLFESNKEEPVNPKRALVRQQRNSANSAKKHDKNPTDVVIEKLLKSNKQADKMPLEELREWALTLSNLNELKLWYLNKDFASTIKVYNRLENVADKLQTSNFGSSSGHKRLYHKLFQSSAQNKGSSEPDDEEQEGDQAEEGGEDEELEDDDFNIEDISKENEQPFMKVGKKIKIKLVIAEICKTPAKKALRKFLSPILTKMDNQQHFGLFHSALIVGPWYLEWNNSSLCIPRKCYSSAAMLAADLEFGGQFGDVGFDLEKTVEVISRVIIRWNTEVNYDQKKANCQHFVDEICKDLGISLRFEGPLGDYLQQVREKGVCDLAFPISDDMREVLRIEERKVVFNTHLELDEFVNKLFEKDCEFNVNWPLEWNLLKSFDRAFWLRHFKFTDNAKYTPFCYCPFGDPTKTASLKPDWF